jgi:hypothetical protein
MTLSRATTCRRLSALGWPQAVVHRIVDQVDLWVKSSGEAWTVERLKALRVYAIRRWAGESINILPDGFARHADGTPKGPFRPLFQASSCKERGRALNTLLAYSGFVSREVTGKQWVKFAGSVEHPEPAQVTSLMQVEILADLPREQRDRFRNWANAVRSSLLPEHAAEPRPLDSFVASPTKRAPYWDSMSFKVKTTLEANLRQWVPSSIQSWMMTDCGEGKCFKEMRPDLEYAVRDKRDRRFMAEPTRNDWMGKVAFLQEPGFKLRAIANPNRLVQLALDPLKRHLFNVLRTSPALVAWDCTHDQDQGVNTVWEWLKQGKTCYCVDLSDATNQFPFSLQLEFLRTAFPSEGKWRPFLDLFERASKGKWVVNDPTDSGRQRDFFWSKGQPLGLGPSFASFSLAHHVVAQLACISAPGSTYVLLGDDIVLSGNPDVYDRYRAILRQLGCPVSEEKSFGSNRLAEFAGKVIMPEGIVPLAKWRSPSDRNFVDLLQFYGPRFLGILPRHHREVAKRIAEVPLNYGGLGWNPKGKNHTTLVNDNLQVIRQLQSEHSGTPMETSSELLNHWRLEVGATTPAFQAQAIDKIAPPKAGLREKILASVGVVEERVREEEPILPGFRPAQPHESDPRGATALDTLSRKLKVRRPPRSSKPDVSVKSTGGKKFVDPVSLEIAEWEPPKEKYPEKTPKRIRGVYGKGKTRSTTNQR